MRTLRVQLFAIVALLTAFAAGAADPFYTKILQRGLTSAQQGKHAQAVKQLKIAAFGLLDDVASYELAQVYIALSNEKLGDSEAVRFAADKLVKAERVSAKYASLQLDPATRATVDKLVRRSIDPILLADVAAFQSKPQIKQEPPPQVMIASAKEPARAPVKPPVVRKQEPVPQQVAIAAKKEPAVAPEKKPEPPPQVVIAAKEPVRPPVTPPVMQKKSVEIIEQPRVVAPAPKPEPAAPKQSPEVIAKLAEARRMLNEGSMIAARKAYAVIAQRRDLDRSQWLEVGKGLNQTAAWQESAIAYQRVQPFRPGEEMHMFYEAVNRYELGELSVARSLFGRAEKALPNSREVQLYRPKIESGF